MIIVVDTNALWTSQNTPYRETAAWKSVLEIARKRPDVRVVIPEVVLREHANHEAQDHDRARRTATRALRTAKFEAARIGVAALELDQAVSALEEAQTDRGTVVAAMWSELSTAGIVIAPLPDVPHSEIVEWSLDNHAPFDATDRGYRDALLWWTICESASDLDSGDVVFVTNDKDFRKADHLHPDLTTHFGSLNPDREITVVKSVNEALRLMPIPPDRPADHEDRDDDFPTVSEIVVSGLAGAVETLWGESLIGEFTEYGSSTLDIVAPHEVENATVVSVDFDPATVVVDTQEILDGDTTLGSVTVIAQVLYEGYVHKADQYEGAEWFVTDPEWNQQYVEVQGYLAAEMEFTFIVAGESLEGLDLVSAQEIQPID